MRVDILVSADPFLDRKATLQQNTTSSDFRFAICCQISINCTLSTPHVRNLTARKNQTDTMLNYLPVKEWKQKIFGKQGKQFFLQYVPKIFQRQGFSLGRRPNLFLFLVFYFNFLYMK